MGDVISVAVKGLVSALSHVLWWQWMLAWALYFAYSNLAGALVAPNETSTPKQRLWFLLVNIVAGNKKRAELWKRGLKE